jgi:hypothetical protein
VAYAVQEVSKAASKGVQNGTLCSGNERCAVKSLPVGCPRVLAVFWATSSSATSCTGNFAGREKNNEENQLSKISTKPQIRHNIRLRTSHNNSTASPE